MIQVEGISKNFHEYRVLDNINLQVKQGSIHGLVGPNGAGKTTLIKIIMGILLPDQGRVTIEGVDVRQNPGIKSRVGYVADYQNYYPGFNVQDMIKLYRETYSGWNNGRFAQLYQLFKLPLNKKVKNLSKGMRTQLAILLNLSIAPSVLVLDEPTSGLDPVLHRQILNILMDEVAHNQTSVFISTHNLSDLERICDQVSIIYKGSILLDQSIAEMKSKVKKIQVAVQELLPDEFLKQEFILKYERQGRVYNIVVRKDAEKVMAELQHYRPLLLETVNMPLEDIFINIMEEMGYGFEQIFTQQDTNLEGIKN